jgi:hypothetical protein
MPTGPAPREAALRRRLLVAAGVPTSGAIDLREVVGGGMRLTGKVALITNVSH